MKKEVFYVAVFGVLCVLAGVLFGAGIVKRGSFPVGHRPGGASFAERSERFAGKGLAALRAKKGRDILEKIAVDLALNVEQKERIKGILENSRQEIDKIGDNMRGSINEIREKSDKRIMAILDPEQQEKFKSLLKKHGMDRRPRQPGEDFGPRRPGEDPGLDDGPRPVFDEGMPPPG
ncbi:MAG: hypothetical protein PHH68_05110 [Candidatus Omnitrophica bacterium]|nr:hypothetical protein [Candidatus Omnitrophota bacterium]MDD5079691.1 hypothetical protein [Candidatus Omnitrophota bacterium]